MDEKDNKSIVLLPPIKKSENLITISSRSPVLFANHINHKKEVFELGMSKFEILTNQPTDVENCKLSSLSSNSHDKTKSFPRSTPLTYLWDTKEIPKMKIFKSKTQTGFESANERRMRLLFDQMTLLKQKNETQINRQLIAQQLAESSRSLKNSSYNAAILKSNDLWESTQYKDINYLNQVIGQYYSLDNRQIRFFRRVRPDFYKFTKNTNINNLEKLFDNLENTDSSI